MVAPTPNVNCEITVYEIVLSSADDEKVDFGGADCSNEPLIFIEHENDVLIQKENNITTCLSGSTKSEAMYLCGEDDLLVVPCPAEVEENATCKVNICNCKEDYGRASDGIDCEVLDLPVTLKEESQAVTAAVASFLTDSCQADCKSIQLPVYQLDPDLSFEENIAKSTAEAESMPLSVKGLAVSTPAELQTKVSGLLETKDDQSPFSTFNTIPTTEIAKVLGEKMVSSINGYMVEVDTCMGIERCLEIGNTTQCYTWLTSKNAFKAFGTGPFTTQIIGLSPLVAQRVNLVLTFEGNSSLALN